MLHFYCIFLYLSIKDTWTTAKIQAQVTSKVYDIVMFNKGLNFIQFSSADVAMPTWCVRILWWGGESRRLLQSKGTLHQHWKTE